MRLLKKRNSPDELTELLGYAPTMAMRLTIVAEMRETGFPLAKVADRYALPPLAMLDEDDSFMYNGKRMTLTEWQEKWPYRRIITINT